MNNARTPSTRLTFRLHLSSNLPQELHRSDGSGQGKSETRIGQYTEPAERSKKPPEGGTTSKHLREAIAILFSVFVPNSSEPPPAPDA